MLPHQERVIKEKQELDIKAKAISEFIGNNPTFNTLSESEQLLLKEQCEIMWEYSTILGKRIELFTHN